MTAPSNANTSGLEVSLSAILARAICESEGKEWTALDNTREDVERWFHLGEVTAASAQARIAELEAENEALTKALTGLTCGGSEFFTRKGDRYVADIKACVDWVRRAKNDAHRRSVVAIKRATAAEARADKLLDALRAVDYARGTDMPGDWTRATKLTDHALQQEG